MGTFSNQEANLLDQEEIKELSIYQKYIRQITLPQFGMKGQDQLQRSKVLIVGVGGLGTPAALYLAAAGIGTIGIIDGDYVEASNLARQVLFREEDLGLLKVDCIENQLLKKNKEIHVHKYPYRLDEHNAEEIIQGYDLILNGTDNFKTRYLLNRLCVKYKKTWIDAGVIQYSGQLVTFYPDKGCYQCLFPEVLDTQVNCSTMGIIGPICGVFGSLQALQAMKVLLGIGSRENKLFFYESLSNTTHEFSWKKKEDCSCCASNSQQVLKENNRENIENEEIVISSRHFLELISKSNSLIVDIDIGMERKSLSKAPIIQQSLEQIFNIKSDFYEEYDYVIYICPYGHKSKLAAEYVQKIGVNGLSLKDGISGVFSL